MAAIATNPIKPKPAKIQGEARHRDAQTEPYLKAAAELLGSDPSLRTFFESFTRHASAEDLTQYTGAELAALVKRVFAHTATRQPGAPLVEIFDAGAEDPAFGKQGLIVLAVNDDMPFLYDSGTAEVRAQGAQIAAAFHPMM